MTERNNDSAVKEILAQISKDESAAASVLKEIRNIVVRDLQASGFNSTQSKGDVEQTTTAPSQTTADAVNLSTNTSPRGGFLDRLRANRNERKQQNEQHPPEKEDELAFTIAKDSDTYKKIFAMVQWYRDSFLVGCEFADRRSEEKQSNTDSSRDYAATDNLNIFSRNNSNTTLPKQYTNLNASNFTGMGHPLLLSAAENYISSKNAVDLLRPTALWLASTEGPILQPATQSLSQSIPLFQNTCDFVMRDNMLWVLKDQEWKDFAKSITTQYVDRSHKDE